MSYSIIEGSWPQAMADALQADVPDVRAKDHLKLILEDEGEKVLEAPKGPLCQASSIFPDMLSIEPCLESRKASLGSLD
eukprot:1090658-Pelagomonas_calceolata.AAC.1